MRDRTYIPARGFAIEGQSFTQHQASCDICRSFDPKDTASLSKLCLDGAVLWKKDNAQPVKRETELHSPYHTSAKAARKLMQYK